MPATPSARSTCSGAFGTAPADPGEGRRERSASPARRTAPGRQGVDPGRRDLAILLDGPAAAADASYDVAVDVDRQTAADDHESPVVADVDAERGSPRRGDLGVLVGGAAG